MNSEEIYDILRNDEHANNGGFLGVFALDRIPLSSIDYPCSMVCNTDKYGQPGSHWVAIFKDENNKGYYFDSYGFSPQYPELTRCLDFSEDWTYNKTQLQSLFSTTCGQYCIYVILHLAKGYTPREIIASLNHKDLEVNDAMVNAYMKDNYTHMNFTVKDYPYMLSQISKREKWNGFI